MKHAHFTALEPDMTVDKFEALQAEPAKFAAWKEKFFAKQFDTRLYVWTSPLDRKLHSVSLHPIVA